MYTKCRDQALSTAKQIEDGNVLIYVDQAQLVVPCKVKGKAET